jgi:Tol biopolymer transport system component
VLFCVSPDDKTYDIWGASVSWKQMRTTGPATAVFKNWGIMPRRGACLPGIWSPDGRKVAIMQATDGKNWIGEIWIGALEGGTPMRMSKLVRIPSPGLKGWPVWSPDGSMIAFNTSLSETEHVIQVASASGGEPRTLVHLTNTPGGHAVFGGFGGYAWSPDSKALITTKGLRDMQLLSVAVSDGHSEPVVNVKDMCKGLVCSLQWSPDGEALAFSDFGEGPIFLYHPQDGSITRIADKAMWRFWSPDSKWISYSAFRFIKTRPEGILWEMDVEEALAKLSK